MGLWIGRVRYVRSESLLPFSSNCVVGSWSFTDRTNCPWRWNIPRYAIFASHCDLLCRHKSTKCHSLRRLVEIQSTSDAYWSSPSIHCATASRRHSPNIALVANALRGREPDEQMFLVATWSYAIFVWVASLNKQVYYTNRTNWNGKESNNLW